MTEKFTMLCQRAGVEWIPYRGRFMDSECVGIASENVMSTVADLIEACYEYDGDDELDDPKRLLADALRDCRQDSLGYQTMLYFPALKKAEEEEEEEEENEDI